MAQDKGGPSKGGFLNNILFSCTDLYLGNAINGMCIKQNIIHENNILFRKSPLLGPPLSLPEYCKPENRHLGNRRGFPVASSDGLSVASSNIFSLFSGILQRIVTCPVDVYWKSPMDSQWHFPTKCHFYDFWCGSFCPERPDSKSPCQGGLYMYMYNVMYNLM